MVCGLKFCQFSIHVAELFIDNVNLERGLSIIGNPWVLDQILQRATLLRVLLQEVHHQIFGLGILDLGEVNFLSEHDLS